MTSSVDRGLFIYVHHMGYKVIWSNLMVFSFDKVTHINIDLKKIWKKKGNID